MISVPGVSSPEVVETCGEDSGPERGSNIGVGVEGIFISAVRVIFDTVLAVLGEFAISGEV